MTTRIDATRAGALSRPRAAALLATLFAVLCAVQPGPAVAQEATLMTDPSLDDLRSAFAAKPISRAFRPTALPSSTDGACAANAKEAPAEDDKEGGSGSRNLVVVPYGGSDAPHADLAVNFANDSDALTATGRKVLDKMIAVLTEPSLAAARFAIAGHTDATGADRLNRELSCARAIAVRSYLVVHGVASRRLSAYGFGSSKPLEPGVVQSAKNRRVEFRRAD